MPRHRILALLLLAGGLAALDLQVGPGAPYATIQAAVDALPAALPESCAILIAPGRYREQVVVGGTATARDRTLTLRPADPAAGPVVIDAEDVREHALVVRQQEQVVVEGLELRGGTGFGTVFLDRVRAVTVRRCLIAGAIRYDGITLSGAIDCTITHNLLANHRRAGIYLNNSSTGARIHFNLLVGNGSGIEMGGAFSSQPVRQRWNLFHANRVPFAGLAADDDALHADPLLASRAPGREDGRLLPASPCLRWGPQGAASEADPAPGERLLRLPGGFFAVPLAGPACRALQDDRAQDGRGGWTDQGDYDLRHAPRGLATFAGIPFHLPEQPGDAGALILQGVGTPGFPARSGELPVGACADRLSFLQACAWAAGETVATWTVTYADGRTASIPMQRKATVDDWWNPADLPGARVAWKAPHPLHPEAVLGFYLATWDNPYPYVAIRSLELVAQGGATPIVLAVTGHPLPSGAAPFRTRLAAAEERPLAGRPTGLRFDASGRSERACTAQVVVNDASGAAIFTGAPQTVDLAGGTSVRLDIPWTPPERPGRAIYKAVGRLACDGRTVSEATAFIAVAGTGSDGRPRIPVELQGDRPVGGANLLYGVELQPWKQIHFAKRARGAPPPVMPPEAFDEVKRAGATVAHLVCWWAYLEPRPGEYDFRSLEYGLEQCRRVGLKASISVWMGDHGVPDFLVDENMLDQDGRPMLGDRGLHQGTGRHPSIWGPRSRAAFEALVQSVCRRYLEAADVVAWGFLYQHIEVPIHDRPASPVPVLYDYSPWAQTAFRTWLRTARGFDLEALNRRYGTAWTAWEQVAQPAPRPGLDASLRWSDFQDFRLFSLRESYRLAFRAVRAVDPHGRKRLFSFNPRYAADLCAQYDVDMDFTGSEGLESRDGMLLLTLDSPRPPLVVEPTTIPPGVFEIGAGFFNACSVPAQGYLWVGTERHAFSAGSAPARLFSAYRDAWVELSGARRQPAAIATLYSTDTVLADEKILLGGAARRMPGGSYFALLERLAERQLDWQPVSDSFFITGNRELPATYRLVVDQDSQVMRRALQDVLLAQLDAGATVLLEPLSGRYCREDPVPAASLAARLGWGAEAAAWAASAPAPGGTATVAAEAPFAAGSVLRLAERFPIESLARGTLVRDTAWRALARIIPIGRGRVVLTAGRVDWSHPDSGSFLAALAAWSGWVRPVQAGDGVWASLLTRGAVRYALLFNSRGDAHAETRLGLAGLAEGAWTLHDLTDGGAPAGTVAGADLARGWPLILAPHELRIYRLDPP